MDVSERKRKKRVRDNKEKEKKYVPGRRRRRREKRRACKTRQKRRKRQDKTAKEEDQTLGVLQSLTSCLGPSSNPARSINFVKVVCAESAVYRFAPRIPGSCGGGSNPESLLWFAGYTALPLGAAAEEGMSTSIVSELVVRTALGRTWTCGGRALVRLELVRRAE